MLNDAYIDIDEEPLGDYENGHIGIDDAKDVEEKGGDDDLEEVDAGTYEDTKTVAYNCVNSFVLYHYNLYGFRFASRNRAGQNIRPANCRCIPD
jgi:hypothetical protein